MTRARHNVPARESSSSLDPGWGSSSSSHRIFNRLEGTLSLAHHCGDVDRSQNVSYRRADPCIGSFADGLPGICLNWVFHSGLGRKGWIHGAATTRRKREQQTVGTRPECSASGPPTEAGEPAAQPDRAIGTARCPQWGARGGGRSLVQHAAQHHAQRDHPGHDARGQRLGSGKQCYRASLVSGPSHGTLGSLNSNGTFSYTPTTGYRGFDSFTYRVSDGTANSNTVEALIAVGGYLGPRTNQDGVAARSVLAARFAGARRTAHAGPEPDLSIGHAVQRDCGGRHVAAFGRQRAQRHFGAADIQRHGRDELRLQHFGTHAGSQPAVCPAGQHVGVGHRALQLAMDVTTTTYGIPTVHSFTGSTNVVNRNSSSAPFGRGWQLSGLDQLVCPDGRRAVGAQRRHDVVVCRQRHGRVPACRRATARTRRW